MDEMHSLESSAAIAAFPWSSLELGGCSWSLGQLSSVFGLQIPFVNAGREQPSGHGAKSAEQMRPQTMMAFGLAARQSRMGMILPCADGLVRG